jgi:hypothetical protein
MQAKQNTYSTVLDLEGLLQVELERLDGITRFPVPRRQPRASGPDANATQRKQCAQTISHS